MKYKFFTITAHSPGEDEKQLNVFLSSHKIVNLKTEFVEDKSQSFWSVCVSFIDQTENTTRAGKKRIDYKEVLNEHEFALFAKLRELRKKLADKEGVPAYSILCGSENDQIAILSLFNMAGQKRKNSGMLVGI